MAIVDFWDMVEEQKKSPCYGCESGMGSIGQFVDKDTGRLMQESHDCSETCPKLKEVNYESLLQI